ncbi:hypothetical protein PAZH1_14 [Pseudomonas phage PA_ZH1]|nr:hypothetical protein [Pseudomonas aeruginosa]QGK90011.1 hypothetical protein [Pseudomonas phage vB_PA32_GUMS]QOV07868.1 hypothetical protein [Pseudomonas phage vB_PaeM_kmuB]UXD83354.1 hypothetical protein NP274_00308 [Pseudomonas phage Koomba boorn-mokiny kep-wari Wadjak 1]WPJ69137.1 hypothetical protein PAZH1_14 [Pseudomonas phage PA_ZH1]BDR25393.1 hypothetical protein RVBP15_1970 [Pseudomonas phage sp. 30-1]BDR26548.1 hypothetical protein RVBP18_2030 [Pseudomonas phage sp. LC]
MKVKIGMGFIAVLMGIAAAGGEFYYDLTKPEGKVSKEWCQHPAKPKCTMYAFNVKEDK